MAHPDPPDEKPPLLAAGLDAFLERPEALLGPAWRYAWPAFERALQDKLDRGYREYGDGSFDRPPGELLDELAAEALDLAGWGFVLWARIERMRARAAAEGGDTSSRNPNGGSPDPGGAA